MSRYLKLDAKDFIRGLVVTTLAAVLSALLTLLNSNGLDFSGAELQAIAVTALTTGISYLLKNLATDEQGKLGGRWQIK